MFHFANIFNSKFQNNYCFVQKLPLSINKKVQSQRFALQELLKQFLLMHHYCTSIFLSHKKVQSQRFALQELLKQFLLMHHYCTSIFLFHKKVQSRRFALQELLKQFLLMHHCCTSIFLSHKKGAKPALYQKFNVPLNFWHLYYTSSFLFRKKGCGQNHSLS